MSDLNKKAFEGLAQFFVALAGLVLLPAWSLSYWQAWLFLGVFFASVLAITLYLMKKDRALLQRRMSAGPRGETEKSQKIIQTVASVAFISLFLVSSFDHRFAWSVVPAYIVIAGDILVALGLLAVFFVFKANTFTSATVEVDPAQKVISTGPYALVRHPMYAGAFVMLLGVPLALGSWWGMLAVIPLMLVIVWRLLEEENFLNTKLPGYHEYSKKVRYRLIPNIW